ncbi:MAG: 3-(3-hydroxy-phenyl)propionate transporter MhpT [Caulobacteraceae bacterium]
MTDANPAEARGGAGRVIALCFLAALLEGVDIQSMGVTLSKLGPLFHLSKSQGGLAASTSIIGLMIGAAIGGRLSDRIGRKKVLLGALCLLGVFSLGTTYAWDFNSLLGMRLLTGLGMGAAFPNLIALTTEAASPKMKATAVSLMYCGMPVGGAIASLIAAMNPDWKLVFYVGGFGPLVLVPLILLLMPESRQFLARDKGAETAHVAQASTAEVLTGNGRGPATAFLWVSFFFTLLVVYMLINWLPSLMELKGLTRPESLIVTMIMNLGSAIGAVTLGSLMDRGHIKPVVVIMYVGMAAALSALAFLQGVPMMQLGGFLAGFFAIGGQLVLYALSPQFYPTLMRGTGVGAAVAVGRLGSIGGPIVAGSLVQSGQGPAVVIAAMIPGLVIAGISALVLVGRPRAEG